MVSYLWENLFRKDNKREIVKILKETYLFETLSEQELNFVKNLVHVRNFKSQEPIFRQGEVGLGMYILIHGSVDIYVEDPQAEDPTKQTVFVTRLKTPDFFGEQSLVEDKGRRTATATAAEDTSVLGFYKPDLLEVIERNPSTGVKIVQRLSEVLGRRLKDTAASMTELKRELRKLNESAGRQ